MRVISPIGLRNRCHGGGNPIPGITLSLNHLDGLDGATSTTDDISTVIWTLTGSELDTAQAKFGVSSLLIPAGAGTATAASLTALNVTGNWTIEMFVRLSNVTTSSARLRLRNFAASDDVFALTVNTIGGGDNGILGEVYNSGGSTIISISDVVTTINANTWYHIALVKNGTTYSLYFDGNRLGTDTTATAPGSPGNYLFENLKDADDAWIDEVRLSQIVRYSGATYTIPTTAFIVD